MGIHSPLRAAAPGRRPELELFGEEECGKATAAAATAAAEQKPWWEARHLALPLCSFAGGPPAARHLAALSRTWRRAVVEAWPALADMFPCRLYVVGGLTADFRPLGALDRFDPLTGAWEALPKLPVPRAGPSAAVMAGRLYVLGGERRGHALGDARRFDPWLGRWEALPPMATARVRAAAVACGGYLYVIGGLDGSTPLRSAERYDPVSRVWEALPGMQRARYACTAAARGSRVFAIGGDIPEAGAPAASVEVYDTETGRWEFVSGLQAPGCGTTVAADSDGRAAFVLGGLGLSGQASGLARHLALDRLAASGGGQGWAALPPMPTPRHLVSAAAFGGGVVAVGGKGATFQASAAVEFFDAEAKAWQDLPPLPCPRLRCAVAGGLL